MADADVLIEVENLSRCFPRCRALGDVSFQVRRGEIAALLGPNGSGKSTLNKVLTGAVRPDRATIVIDGREVVIKTPRDAHKHGIAAVYQQLSLVPYLTVAENLALGVEQTTAGVLTPTAQRRMIGEMIERLAPGLGPGVGLNTRVGNLHPGTRQLLEFGKAMLRRPRFLVLDEATASLRNDQVALQFEMVREATAAGVAVIFVSHRMEEVHELCDRATILRNGLVVADVEMAATSEREIVRLMVGDNIAEYQRLESNADTTATPALEVADLTGPGVRSVSFALQPGEVLGLGGLQGQGQSDLLLTLFGASPATGGTIRVQGQECALTSPRAAIRQAIALVPGDRNKDGFYAGRSILENISTVTLPRRALCKVGLAISRERAVAKAQVEALRIKIGSLNDPVSSLSGGNAQKVVIAKWLPAQPRVVLLDDPTKGVDVGAKAEIYGIIRNLTSQGVAVILNTSDDMELAELADRVLVMYEGRIVEEITGDAITHDTLVAAALRIGAGPQQPAAPTEVHP